MFSTFYGFLVLLKFASHTLAVKTSPTIVDPRKMAARLETLRVSLQEVSTGQENSDCARRVVPVTREFICVQSCEEALYSFFQNMLTQHRNTSANGKWRTRHV